MAHCAGEQERFWEANDYLYKNGRRKNPVLPEEMAEAIGIDAEALRACMVSEDAKSAVLEDINAGRELKLRGTPTYVIGGQTYPGSIPEEVIAEALEPAPND
jgi:protein-disulfide isomerase